MERHKNKLNIVSVIRRSTPSERKRIKLSEQQLEKLETVGKIALAVVAGAGVVALSAVAPNIFTAIDKLFLAQTGKLPTKREKEKRTADAFYYLKRSGQIIMKPTVDDIKLKLTRLGKRRAKKLQLDTVVIAKPGSWHGKYWLVVADIPTKKYKRGADLFREKLKELGFYPLQRTVWIYPHDPREEVEFIVNHYGIERFVTVMEINRLDVQDEWYMKNYFVNCGLID